MIIKETFHCLTTALLYTAEFNLRVNDKVNRFLKLRGHLIQEVLIAILITCFLSFYNFIFYIFCNQRVRKLKNCYFANGFNLMNSRVIKKILLLNQRPRDAVTCVAHILQESNSELRTLLSSQDGQSELQFMHFQSDMKKQK